MGTRFSMSGQTGAAVNPASCAMATVFPGIKRPGLGVDH